MSFTFKNFTRFLELPEDAPVEQINELFGIFRNNKKIEDLKKKREELMKSKAAKDAAWKAAKNKVEKGIDADENSEPVDPLKRGTATARAQAARDRKGDLAWMGEETGDKKFDSMLKQIVDTTPKATDTVKRVVQVPTASAENKDELDQTLRAIEKRLPESCAFKQFDTDWKTYTVYWVTQASTERESKFAALKIANELSKDHYHGWVVKVCNRQLIAADYESSPWQTAESK